MTYDLLDYFKPRFSNFINIFTLLLFMNYFTCSYSNILEIHGPFSADEYIEMKDESLKLIDMMSAGKNITSSMDLHKTSNFTNHTDSMICKACLYTFTKFHNILDKKYGLTLLNEFLSLMCSTILDFSICKKAVDLYSPTVVDALTEHYLDAEFLCTKSYMCKYSHFQELNADDYARELLKDKPNVTKGFNIITGNSTFKVLHVTDIHTDMLYNEVN